jgi:hypothetical protein
MTELFVKVEVIDEVCCREPAGTAGAVRLIPGVCSLAIYSWRPFAPVGDLRTPGAGAAGTGAAGTGGDDDDVVGLDLKIAAVVLTELTGFRVEFIEIQLATTRVELVEIPVLDVLVRTETYVGP